MRSTGIGLRSCILGKDRNIPSLVSYIVLPPFINIRYFSFVK
jgi:hypothetical protein